MKNDNLCHDENNFEGCDWDGGDCCGDNVKKDNCSLCQCLDPIYYSKAIESNWQENDLSFINSTMTDFMTEHNVVGSSLAIVKDGRLVYAKGSLQKKSHWSK